MMMMMMMMMMIPNMIEAATEVVLHLFEPCHVKTNVINFNNSFIMKIIILVVVVVVIIVPSSYDIRRPHRYRNNRHIA